MQIDDHNYRDAASLLDGEYKVTKGKGVEYVNLPMAFDIETTSFYRLRGTDICKVENPGEKEYSKWEKCNTMYCYVLGINGRCHIGRTWEEFMKDISLIKSFYHVSINRRIVIYIHNLAYEFQYLRHLFEWSDVFALDKRKPVRALTADGIEFRCSYLLSARSLKGVGENLTRYKDEKMEGDLDYKMLRNSSTPLTEKEVGYVIHDGLVVMAYIAEMMEDEGDLRKIPLTNTGFVRRHCRNNCLYESNNHDEGKIKFVRYRRAMKGFQIVSEKEYRQLRFGAFQGGFTHTNAMYSRVVCNDVASFDFTSSYPYCMIACKFPMSTGRLVTPKSQREFNDYLMRYCCMFDVKFRNLRQKISFESYLSYSKCRNISSNVTVNNGRIVDCEELSTTLTELDFFIIKRVYEWDDMSVKNMRVYRKGYLPTDFVKTILDLYEDKTRLKGVEGREVDYLRSKGMVNSIYGMAVTDIARMVYKYDEDWTEDRPDYETELRKYNTIPNRFSCYHWGVWTTAWARYNLWSGILECGEDYIYSDTDSIKIMNAESHMRYIKNYNRNVLKKLSDAMEYHKLPMDKVSPVDIYGKTHTLGLWDYEGTYSRFKALRAKAYMTEKDGKISITVSGVNKKKAVPYLMKKFGDKIFDAFDDSLYIPPEYTGKNIHTYIDDEMEGELTDYLGNTKHWHEMSSIHMEETDYSLSLADAYIKYLMDIKEERE